MVRMPDEDGFVVADIPGLIAGAHEGRGLGDRFLRHIERTRLLVHLVDVTCIDGRSIPEQVEEIETELGSYGQNLLEKPRLLALNKIDALSESELEEARREGEGLGLPVWCISAVSGQGVEPLLFAVYGRLKEMKKELVH
jgi:GTP-binding protein